MSLMLGYVGLIVLVCCTPVAIAFGILCLDSFCSITAIAAFWCIVLGTATSLVSEYLWARCIILTTPTVATVGLGLGTPLAIAIDVVLGTPGTGNVSSIIGGVLTIIGFIVVQVETAQWGQLYTYISGAED